MFSEGRSCLRIHSVCRAELFVVGSQRPAESLVKTTTEVEAKGNKQSKVYQQKDCQIHQEVKETFARE